MENDLASIPPPLESESKVEFRVRKTREQIELRRSLLESVEMADEDELLKSTRAPKLKRSSRHFFNIHKQPDHETKYDSNAELQRTEPNRYGRGLDGPDCGCHAWQILTALPAYMERKTRRIWHILGLVIARIYI